MNFSRPLRSSVEQSYNKCSRIITQDKSQGASQAMLYALGMTEKDFSKGLVAIGSNWFESNPCNNHLDQLSREVKKVSMKVINSEDFNLIPLELAMG